ncbi:hypothetical protein FYK55_01585 [Roseiconus nitratireducens]|uniref:Uncharacterized protein n=1 Tax=Roseiconus nitratireducens TaxID=2605748 RepID=A0A5M6DHW7_9BACT|nr:hypothetical protein [Roseiconus nitratireducens]KAA5547134.1 hypothetical protein FYK55_01585 [Roseiconus nitratireducens]
MKLSFLCLGNIDDPAQVSPGLYDEVIAQFQSGCDQGHQGAGLVDPAVCIAATIAVVAVDADHATDVVENRFQVRFEVATEEVSEGGEQRQAVDRILQLLCELSERFPLNWVVGHELDSHLGSIIAGTLQPALLEELETSFHVAQLLGGMLADEGWTDREVAVDESDCDNQPSESLADDPSIECEERWNALLDPEETFRRFPEWD